jgi:hypothetical protein
MSQRSVKRFLAVYFLILYGAVFLRIDYFPLSWVPMYGYRDARPTLVVSVGNQDLRSRGFAAQRANGERLFISARDLNIPNANFRRLYHQRAFNNGPPQDDRERHALSSFNRWWYETLVGPDPRLNANYPADLLESVNRTFGYGRNDPRRIVRLESHLDFATFEQDKLDRGDLSKPLIERRVAVITEQGTHMITPRGTIALAGAGRTNSAGETVD